MRKKSSNTGLSVYRYSSYCFNPNRHRVIAHSFIEMNPWIEYKHIYLTRCAEACGDGSIDDENQHRKRLKCTEIKGFRGLPPKTGGDPEALSNFLLSILHTENA